MNQLFVGSICLTDLIEHAKHGHSAFIKAQNKKVYVNILTWQNEEPDKYGNSMSHQLNSAKDKKEAEGKIYIGNSKKLDVAVSASDLPTEDFSNVKEKEPVKQEEQIVPIPDDLPF